MQLTKPFRFSVSMVVVFAVLTSAVPGSADLKEDLEQLREEQSEVQKNRELQAADVNAATAEVGDLTLALQVVTQQVGQQQAAVSAAEQRLAATEAELDEANKMVEEQEAEILKLESRLQDRAISSFVTQNAEHSVNVFEDTDPNEAIRMKSLVESVTNEDLTVAEDLERAKDDLEFEEAQAAAATKEAEELEAELADGLEELAKSQEAQTALVDEAESRLEAQLAEAWALEQLDKDLSDKIKNTNKKLAEQAAAAARRRTGKSNSGAKKFPSVSEIVKVKGFWVHVDIASSVEAMFTQAEAEGHKFGGGAYRDSQSQIRLRRSHCGTSDYAVYRMPASQCRPPTARPGASMHEQGKALDLQYNGRLITSRSNAGFKWLKDNAASYGFFNLPSEPWHWSVNGR